MKEAARRIVERLRGEGHIAYFAGGCVRDIVRRVTPKDYDVATSATPETVQKIQQQFVSSYKGKSANLSETYTNDFANKAS